ncbi:MAG: hypothetical protein HZB76_03885 [Chlamydiae bacterium]|nr:hypothetical protein [Chlamydiota bacterium]
MATRVQIAKGEKNQSYVHVHADIKIPIGEKIQQLVKNLELCTAPNCSLPHKHYASDKFKSVKLNEFINCLNLLEELSNQDPKINHYLTAKVFSLLSMILAYRDPDTVKNILGHLRIPVFVTGKKRYFELEETLDLGGGMKSFGLVEITQDPHPICILLSHGTYTYAGGRGAGQTILDDADPFGAAFLHFFQERKNVQAWVDKHKNSEIFSTGHSLGGMWALRMAAHITGITKTYAFCPPFLDQITLNKLENSKAKICVFITKDDPIQKIPSGKTYPGSVYKIIPALQNINPAKAHTVPWIFDADKIVKLKTPPSMPLSKRLGFTFLGNTFIWTFTAIFLLISRILFGQQKIPGIITFPKTLIKFLYKKITEESLKNSNFDDQAVQILHNLSQLKKIEDVIESTKKQSYKISAFIFALFLKRNISMDHIPLKLKLINALALKFGKKNKLSITSDTLNTFIIDLAKKEKLSYYFYNPIEYVSALCKYLKLDDSKSKILKEFTQKTLRLYLFSESPEKSNLEIKCEELANVIFNNHSIDDIKKQSLYRSNIQFITTLSIQ